MIDKYKCLHELEKTFIIIPFQFQQTNFLALFSFDSCLSQYMKDTNMF